MSGPETIPHVKKYLTAIQERSEQLQSDGIPLKTARDRLYDEFTRRYPHWGEPHWIRNPVEIAYAEAAN